MSAMGRQATRSQGFTLIELLVIIAIIALLVSILMPSLRRAKELTRTAVCLSNLGQVGTAVSLYAATYRMKGPLAVYAPNPIGDKGEWQYQRGWACHLSEFTEGQEIENAGECKDVWENPSGRVPSSQSVLWGCPNFTNAYQETLEKRGHVWLNENGADHWAKTGYAMNVYVHSPGSSDWNTANENGWWPNAGYTNIATWRNPSSKPLLADHYGFMIIEHYVDGNGPDTFLSARHLNHQAGVLYIDGHASAQTVGQDIWNAIMPP
jgi:prepilin-type N-terminal cleavage/methylation domain-containing protein/prepilin-type processing-associated H-X9-DG protein